MRKQSDARRLTRWWRYAIAFVLRLLREPPVERPETPATAPRLPLPSGGPYREMSVEDCDRARYERGVSAIKHFNKSCPRGFVLFPITRVNSTPGGYTVTYVSKHGTRHMIGGEPWRSWSEFCCEKELQALADAESITTPKWHGRWREARSGLHLWMFEP